MASDRAIFQVFDDAEDRAHETCATCPSLCRSACPVAEAEARETSAPHRLMVQAGLLKNDRLASPSVGGLPWHCTGCSACIDACLHDNQVPFWLLLSRSRALLAGQAPPAVAEAAAAFGVAGNLHGASLEPALHAALASAGTRPSRTAEDVYLPGCETLHALPTAAVDLLRAIQPLGLGDLRATSASGHCCGAPLAWAGELQGFVAHARRYALELESAKRVVVHDPACAFALRVLYPRFGVRLRPEVQTVPGFLRERVSKDPAPRQLGIHGYLDACHLSRGLGEREGPRALLDELLDGRWLPLEEEGSADCCGAAGLLPHAAPETARALAEARIDAFDRSGAEVLLAASPRCLAHLRGVRPDLPIRDIAGLLLAEAP